MIHHFPTPIPVHTPHGYGDAILLIDYGIDVNTVWLVRLEGGAVKHYLSELKPDKNGQHNLEGRICRIENKLDTLYEILITKN